MVTIRTRVDSEILVLPELRPFVGKTVEIRIAEEPDSARDLMMDWDYHAACSAECEADPAAQVSLEEVRRALASIPGNLSEDIRADRDERG